MLITPATSAAVPAKRHAELHRRSVSLAVRVAAKTGTAGHAVAFIAHATPSTTAARSTPDRLASKGQREEEQGDHRRVGDPIASGNAITGEAAANTVQSTT